VYISISVNITKQGKPELRHECAKLEAHTITRLFLLGPEIESQEKSNRIGGEVKLGGLERWLSPRGQDLCFLCPA
jgi:hypothetical protein